MIDTILGWIGSFLGWLDKITGSYMIAIFLFAVIVEILMLLLFGIKQQKNSIKQASLRPKEQAIRKKYAGRDDKVTQQKVSEEIQEMYQKEGYSVFGGCLPALLQLPVIMALYYVVIDPLHYVVGISSASTKILNGFVSSLGLSSVSSRGSIELINLINEKGMNFFADMVDYGGVGAGADAFAEISAAVEKGLPNFRFLGINLAEVPDITNFGLLWLIPVLTFVVYFLSMKITRKFTYQPVTGNEMTDKQTGCSNTMMDLMFPAFSVYIAFIVPAAIGVYWIFKSILGTVKQIVISKVMPLPIFTEEDYKAAEREYAGKTPKEKKQKLNINSGKSDPRSLFHTDDEDYVAPEVENEIARRLSAKDGVSSETSDGAITVAPLKDESDRPAGKPGKTDGKNEKKDIK